MYSSIIYNEILKLIWIIIYSFKRSQVTIFDIMVIYLVISNTQTIKLLFPARDCMHGSWILVYSIARELSYIIVYIYMCVCVCVCVCVRVRACVRACVCIYWRWNGWQEESVAGNQWHVVTLVDLTDKTA